MKKRYSYILLFLIGIAHFTSSCNQKSNSNSGLKNDSKISIQHHNGLFLTSDRKFDDKIFANRPKASGWEEFYILFLEDNSVVLRDSKYNFIGSDDENGGLISGTFIKKNDAIKFQISSEDSILILEPVYVNISIDSTQQLYISEEPSISNNRFQINVIPEKTFPGFSLNQWIPFYFGLLFLVISFILFYSKKANNLSLFLLLLGAFSLRLFIALLTSHFNVWDEQFHALVAKNMMNSPFEPMLYKDPILPYNLNGWTGNHIWLHKQPLFLWQMALSMKLFGVNVFAARLPSVIMSTIVSLFIYRIGKITINRNVGYLSALLFVFSYFNLELISGVIHTDHNDVAFLFYLSGSIWSWIEYENSEGKKKYFFLVLTGVLSGCAILVKWLTGILVYSGWGLSILLIKKRRTNWRNYLDLTISAAITLLVFLPWQIYILIRYPDISNFEYAYNTKHFYEVVENHGGDFWYHFTMMKDIYKIDSYILIICFILFVLFIKKKAYKIAVLTYFISIYLFYSIAATKMIAFTFSISFLIYLSLGFVLYKFVFLPISHAINGRYKFIGLAIVLSSIAYVSYISLDLESIKKKHSTWVKDSASIYTKRLRTTPLIKDLPNQLKNIEEYVIFNCYHYEKDNIQVMFFTDVAASYYILPDQDIIKMVKQKGYKIAVFDDNKLPQFIITDPEIKKIPGYWN